jgi:hypothetical protein
MKKIFLSLVLIFAINSFTFAEDEQCNSLVSKLNDSIAMLTAKNYALKEELRCIKSLNIFESIKMCSRGGVEK